MNFKRRFPTNLEKILDVPKLDLYLDFYGGSPKRARVVFEYLNKERTFFIDGEGGEWKDMRFSIEEKIIEKVTFIKAEIEQDEEMSRGGVTNFRQSRSGDKK